MGFFIPDYNLFMMCNRLNRAALSSLPAGYTVRPCRKEELSIWEMFPFDSEAEFRQNAGYMAEYFQKVYQPKESEFWERCLFLCNKNGIPVGTCFAWKSYGTITTIHWFKVKKELEGNGLGRALLSIVMESLSESDYPVFLHTQPGSYRAIKLYCDFGFSFLTEKEIGFRTNELEQSLPYLKKAMPEKVFDKLRFTSAPQSFLRAVKSSPINQF